MTHRSMWWSSLKWTNENYWALYATTLSMSWI